MINISCNNNNNNSQVTTTTIINNNNNTPSILPSPPSSPIDCEPINDTQEYAINRKRAYSISFIQNNSSTNKKSKTVDSDCLKEFLNRKGSPNTCDGQFKRSLLSWACIGRSTEAIKELMSSVHLDINLKTGPNLSTALHEACLVGFKEGLELLLEHPDIDINALNNQSQTPLYCAVQNNQVDCIKILLSAGARMDIFCQRRLPIHLAILYGYQQCVSILLSKQNQHVNNPSRLDMLWEVNKIDNRSSIESAIVTGYTDTLQLLLDHDSVINKRMPLHQRKHGLVSLAVEWNRIECLQLLIKRGCIMDENSMLMAVQQRKIDIVHVLASANAKFCLPNGQNPAFLYAVNHGFLDMIPLLLTPNTSKDCIQQALLLASPIGLRNQLASIIVQTLKSFIVAKKKNVS
ncbi:ankyrin repeat-containing domain protein [Cokeromyces recurvatus]|uniref:ankyrin repeat-containing domain protein n=1 Tax=Cokeromyces recurvatus TaxID=90255 RepID=UPI0022206AA0|nr:ankyrin repeat-containing domain protein [Cokeromyces recurvatus]KAI7904068.1 ankyrin repeat-containing domain protein [Cokeromyces recurvatus]